MASHRGTVCAIMFVFSLASSLHAQADKQPRLREDDEKLLSSLVREFLFAPPLDAKRVQVRIKAPGWYEKAEEQVREGWLVRDKAGDRVYFTDGEWVPVPDQKNIEPVDFVTKWSEAYKGRPMPIENRHAFFFPGWEERPAGDQGEPTLVIAAWLHHLGKKELAAKVLAHAPSDRTEEVAILKRWLARGTFHRMLQCYGQYEDEAALKHGERLLRLYAAEARQVGQAVPLVNDLRRRQQGGLLGAKAGAGLPADYPSWDRKKKLAYLIDQLDRTAEYLPTSTSADDAFRTQSSKQVAALLEWGEAAVPALLDVIEKDERLTRRVVSPWKWQAIGEVQSVREAALAILYRILKTRHLDPRDPEADDYGFGKPDFKKVVPAARAYWKEFGPLPYEARMMRVLTDPRTSYAVLREAAAKLSVAPGQPEWSWSTDIKSVKPNPAVLKFAGPTAAEAVLAAMDRDLAHDDASPQTDHNRAYHEPVYFSALIRLADERIVAELARRAARDTNALMRVRYAHACFRLGRSQVIIDFAADFGAGKVALRTTDKDGLRWQLERIVEHLTVVKIREADEALYKLGEPKHRYHEHLVNGIVDRLVVYDTAGDFVRHPYCLSVLRKMLDDTTPTPLHMSFREGDGLAIAYGGGGRSGQGISPPVLLDPKMRRASASIRRCDLAGQQCGAFAGLPEFHPLLKDVDGRLTAVKEAIDKYPGKYRRLTPAENLAFTSSGYYGWFVPDISPLGRAATAADVAAGKAIFHFDGKGMLPKLELPARGTWPKAANEKTARTCLIVQAETQPDGETYYGVIEQHALRKAPAREFVDVVPLSKLKVKSD